MLTGTTGVPPPVGVAAAAAVRPLFTGADAIGGGAIVSPVCGLIPAYS